MKRMSLRQKQNQSLACQPRQSLKMSMTSKKKPQKSQARMSMLPLRRQRLSMTIQSQLAQPISRIALKNNTTLLNTTMNSNNNSLLNSCHRSIRKETIINNLVNKLDQDEQIRSIIETKLRRNSYGPNKELMYTSEFQPYSTNTSVQPTQRNLTQQLKNLMEKGNNENTFEEQNTVVLSSKLRQCQEELDYFKSIVSEMSKKVKKLQAQSSSNCKTPRQKQQFQEAEELHNFKSNKCTKCKCESKSKDFSTQTGPQIKGLQSQGGERDNYERDDYEVDFFDNLQRTLKILENSKNL